MSADRTRTIRIHGRQRAYLGQRHVRRRDYIFLLERIGSPFRERFLAVDPCGPVHEATFFQVPSLRSRPETEQQLSVFAHLKDDAFPRVVEWRRWQDHIDVVLTWVPGVSLSDYIEHVRTGRRLPPNPGDARVCHLFLVVGAYFSGILVFVTRVATLR